MATLGVCRSRIAPVSPSCSLTWRAYRLDDVALLELPSRALRARSRERGLGHFGDGASLVRRYASCRGRYGSLPKINCLQRWYRPEFIAIGDAAAHAMSPMFGVGVNHGVQDAVATRQGHRGRPSHRNGPNRQVSGMQQRSPARTRSGGHRDGPARPRRRPRPGLAKPRAAAIRSYVAPAKRMGRTGCWSCSRLPPRTGRRLHHRDRPTHGRRRHRRPACRPVAADHLSPPAG
jgi:hypothetical protein